MVNGGKYQLILDLCPPSPLTEHETVRCARHALVDVLMSLNEMLVNHMSNG